MKRRLIYFFASMMTLLASSNANAQTLFDTGAPTKTIQTGLRLGFNTSNLSTNYDKAYSSIDWSHTQWRQGVTLGAIVDINLRNYFAIQSGLYFKSRNNDYNYLVNNGSNLVAINGKCGAYYFEIPILASFRMGVADLAQLQFDLGPYFSTGFGGSFKYTMTRESDGQVISTKSKTDYFGETGLANRYDWGFKVGAGMLVMRTYYIGIHYNLGCRNILRDMPDTVKTPVGHNKSWSFELGYNF